MALPPTQLKEALSASGAFLEKRRPPLYIRPLLDFRIDIINKDLVLVSNRPSPLEEGKMLDLPVAKARWVNARKRWRLFWMRATGKWQTYDLLPESPTLQEIFDEINRDPHSAFFG